jgi:hypothetical protein
MLSGFAARRPGQRRGPGGRLSPGRIRHGWGRVVASMLGMPVMQVSVIGNPHRVTARCG